MIINSKTVKNQDVQNFCMPVVSCYNWLYI